MLLKLERRMVTAELRADPKTRKIEGHAAVFGAVADIAGIFREQVLPGAFTETIKRDDVRALFNHDANIVLGRNRSGTLRLSEDSKGLAFEIDPPDTQLARDLMVSMERGDISQTSFAFYADKQEWDDTQDPPLRRLRAVTLFDVSPVTYPAYEETDSSVAKRSLEQFRTAALVLPSTLSRIELKKKYTARKAA